MVRLLLGIPEPKVVKKKSKEKGAENKNEDNKEEDGEEEEGDDENDKDKDDDKEEEKGEEKAANKDDNKVDESDDKPAKAKAVVGEKKDSEVKDAPSTSSSSSPAVVPIPPRSRPSYMTSAQVRNTVNRANETAIVVATRSGHHDVVKLLLGYGSDVNSKANNGYTLLMIAAQKGDEDMCSILLASGGDVNIRVGEGKNARNVMDVASQTSNVRHLLFAAGARATVRLRSLADEVKAGANENWKLCGRVLECGHSCGGYEGEQTCICYHPACRPADSKGGEPQTSESW